jgi:signal peptidase I
MSDGRPPSKGFALLIGLLLGPGGGHFAAGLVGRGRAFALLGVASLAAGALALRPLAFAWGLDRAALAIAIGLGLVALTSHVDLALRDSGEFSTDGRPWLALQVAVVGVVMLAVPLGARLYLLDLLRVPSRSMQPTLIIGDFFVVERGAYAGRPPRRGEVIVFRAPEKRDDLYVKRIIGLPGDRVTVKGHSVKVNGRELPKCELGPFHGDDGVEARLYVEWIDGTALLMAEEGEPAGGSAPREHAVGAGELFVLGDNRDQSHDSRFWFEGKGAGVPISDVLGRAWRLVLSRERGRAGRAVAELQLPAGAEALAARLRDCESAPPPSRIPAAP